MNTTPKELRPEQVMEIEARSAWPVRSYGVNGQKQAEEDVRALLGHAAALHKINCLANDRIVRQSQQLENAREFVRLRWRHLPDCPEVGSHPNAVDLERCNCGLKVALADLSTAK